MDYKPSDIGRIADYARTMEVYDKTELIGVIGVNPGINPDLVFASFVFFLSQKENATSVTIDIIDKGDGNDFDKLFEENMTESIKFVVAVINGLDGLIKHMTKQGYHYVMKDNNLNKLVSDESVSISDLFS